MAIRILLIIMSLLAFSSAPAHAATKAVERWTVTQRSGDTRVVRAGLQPASMTINQALAPGDTIITGANGRASLTRGGDYIVVAPRSQMRLPAKPEQNGITAIIQDLGTLLYKVRRTGVPHFTVDTPMLAAVVKGTTFTVVVDKDRSAVQVIEGVVEVTAADGGMRNLVHGGKTVFIDHDSPKSLLTADAVSLGKPGQGEGEAVRISGSEGESVIDVATATAGQVSMEGPKITAPVSVVAAAVVSGVPAGSVALIAAVAIAAPISAPTTTSPTVVAVAGPVVTTPAVPVATVPIVAAPVVTVPIVAAVVTAPVVTVPAVAIPAVTVPGVTVPIPAIAVPVVPVVTGPVTPLPVVAPVVTVPTVITPTVKLPPLGIRL